MTVQTSKPEPFALPRTAVNDQLSQRDARLLALTAQGFGGETEKLPAEIVAAHGFVRTLGGVDVYLAIRQRRADITRAAVDTSVEKGEASIVPAARGCIYLVARRHAVPALALAKRLSARRNEREQQKAGIRDGELAALGDAVRARLAGGALSTTELRRELAGEIRSLGEAGKKVGLSSTLPPALRELELALEIERRPATGRLDNERYIWQRSDSDRDPGSERRPEVEIDPWITDLFFRWAGIATEKALSSWSGLGVRDARRAMASCDLVPVSVAQHDETYWVHGDYRNFLDQPASLERASQAIAFLPFGDNLVAYQQGPAFWVDPEYHGITTPVWGRGRGSTLGDARHSSLRPVIADGRMVGFWELDPDTQQVVHTTFVPISEATRERLAERAERLAIFLRDELGHGRSFSLDTDEAMRRRIAHLRASS